MVSGSDVVKTVKRNYAELHNEISRNAAPKRLAEFYSDKLVERVLATERIENGQ